MDSSFAVGNGSLPVFTTPLKKNGIPTQSNSSSKRDVPAGCDSTISPACLEGLYGYPTAAATQSSNGISVAGFGNQYAQQADLTVS